MTTQQMLSKFRKGITKYKMIKDGDKIAVGVSGGKDSVTLLKLLAEYQRFSPEKFELLAITVDLNFKHANPDYSLIKALCDEYNIPYIIEQTEIGQIVFDARQETNPCALCSKMRKGALYSVVKEHGFNKVALGHHADDLIDTLFLSLFYEGRLSTFAPKSYLDRTDLVMIRPMIMIEESDIVAYSKDLPIVKSCCPANTNTKREYIKQVYKHIGKQIPNVREMVFTALTHPERYCLFDKYESQIDEF
ncbi:MAG: tRNA 2-thiocytidine(32) synthetase TtcA [Clostridia bacterium]|nr:tRNA 2-thiocytidine(32) synthetase TtcA [Clostridia bacterium]